MCHHCHLPSFHPLHGTAEERQVSGSWLQVPAAGPSSHRSDAGVSWVDDGRKGRSWGSSEGGDWQGRSVPSPGPAVDGWLPGAPGLTAVDTELHSLTFPSQLTKHTRNATLPTVPVLVAVDTKLHSVTFPSQHTKHEKCSTQCACANCCAHRITLLHFLHSAQNTTELQHWENP